MCEKLVGWKSLFIAICASVQKDEEEKKTKKKNETVATRISEMALVISFKFGM